jgi:hypothetical protein
MDTKEIQKSKIKPRIFADDRLYLLGLYAVLLDFLFLFNLSVSIRENLCNLWLSIN